VTDHRLGPADAGRDISIAAGDRVVVELPETAGTGYTWQVARLPEGGRLVDEHYEHPGTDIGGSSQHVFVFDPGEGGELRLRHLRPWEGDAGVIDEFVVTIAVIG
jgi:predicted secreted protein